MSRFSSLTIASLFSLIALVAIGVLSGCGRMNVDQALSDSAADLSGNQATRAIRRLEALYAQAPKDPKVIEALAFAQLGSGDAARAGDLFSTLALNGQPDHHLYAAQAYRQAGQPDKAVQAYRLYLLGEPTQATPWLDLGETLISAGQTAPGIEALTRSHDLAPSPQLARRIATLSQQSNSPIQAQRYLQNALKQARAQRTSGSPPSAIEGDILVDLINSALTSARPSEGERHLRQLERDFPSHPQLAALRTAIKDRSTLSTPRPKATKSDRKSTSKKDTQPLGKSQPEPQTITPQPLAITLPPAPVLPAPKDPLLLALERDSRNPERWAALAADKADDGDLAWAQTAYLEALRLRPGYAPYLLSYLQVVKARRTPAEFLAEAEAQMEKHPTLPQLYLLTARSYRDMARNYRNASIIFQNYLNRFPNDPQAAAVRQELEALKNPPANPLPSK